MPELQFIETGHMPTQASIVGTAPQMLQVYETVRRVAQMLNRLTYGPRPGDVERVRALGVAAYLERQLHPETIDDSTVERTLTALPSLELPILAGVTRSLLLELSRYPVEEGSYRLDDLLAADEVFLTSSIREVMPVLAVDENEFSLGPAAAALHGGG